MRLATPSVTVSVHYGAAANTHHNLRSPRRFARRQARGYGDAVFSAMMYIKVVSVHLVTQLGYNVLFQDVDVVWFQDPVQWIMSGSTDGSVGAFDAYFTDDGARSARYAPWSANSGLYYLRANPRTQYLITSLLYAGDNILQSHSHQQALTSVLAEHSSLYGLSIKVVSREVFPGGKSYHHDMPYMKRWMEGELTVRRNTRRYNFLPRVRPLPSPAVLTPYTPPRAPRSRRPSTCAGRSTRTTSSSTSSSSGSGTSTRTTTRY